MALTVLVARWIGIVSAAWCVISTGGSSTSDTYRHSTTYGCTTVNATAINAAVMNASATNASAATAKCEGVS